MKAATLQRWAPWLLAVATVVLWQVGVTAFNVPDFIFPSPWQIAQEFVAYTGPLMRAAWSTFWVTMVGFGLAIAVGVLLGFLIG
ncbi:MAG TPA: ABC transporter permease, partial [Ramlibacter sp.]|nr:ABC transporter permease [Ramlibacter sp.]